MFVIVKSGETEGSKEQKPSNNSHTLAGRNQVTNNPTLQTAAYYHKWKYKHTINRSPRGQITDQIVQSEHP